MLKIAILVWLILGTTFAGAAIVFVLATPSLAGQDMRLIPIAAAIGALVAIPAAFVVAKRILAVTAKQG
ncbi:hypothetical protein K9U40_16415 [Xanthobacter autotrophicus]|uniref:hypothetical protein n=1 Tax=Xanthobacter TaxID=279 RepID=UPI0024AC6BA4|nr:hypothetical protein [Xanthobacter autotrophicus]MDI4665895.1 hypothetical protein [Xanthobacter autotrophicus]